MTNRGSFSARVLVLLLVLALAVPVSALADDRETLDRLPGQWSVSDSIEWTDQEFQQTTLEMTFDQNGTMALKVTVGGQYKYSYQGTWAFRYIENGVDWLTLKFTATDNPAHAGGDYSVECVYGVYTESWEEEGKVTTALILEPVQASDVAPFEEVFQYDGIVVYREQKPNMRVVNCKEFVSLREQRSTGSARLAKVPLGALVLAFPEKGQENGFIWCLYQDQYGYILAEYLEPVK